MLFFMLCFICFFVILSSRLDLNNVFIHIKSTGYDVENGRCCKFSFICENFIFTMFATLIPPNLKFAFTEFTYYEENIMHQEF